MRCENIKVSLEIPVRVNEPDGNGITYTEAAIKNACEKAEGMPIIQYNDRAIAEVIGVTTKVEYREGKIHVKGQVWHGGTEEQVEREDGRVVSMSIMGFSIGE